MSQIPADPNPPVGDDEDAHLLVDRETPQTLSGILNRRRHLGYFLGFLSILGFIVLAVATFMHLAEFRAPDLNEVPFPRFCVLVAGNVAVTVALAYFLYQMLKAAERMAVPAHWVERNPHLLGAMLGIKDPISMLPDITGAVEKALDPVLRIAEGKAKGEGHGK